jgi:hypothetical protein
MNIGLQGVRTDVLNYRLIILVLYITSFKSEKKNESR